MNIDTNKIIDLLIKYKTQVSYLVAFIACVLCFIGGYQVKTCPPKSVVCFAEDKTIKGLRAELIKKDLTRTKQLREQKDKDRIACDKKIEEAANDQRATNDFLECSDICALHPQCLRKGQCK